MNRWFVIPFLLIVFNNYVYGQVTISEIKKHVDTVFLKPEPYDSLKNFKQQERDVDYRQYIGLQFYLPPFSNPPIGSYGDIYDYPFVFSKALTALKMDTVFSPSAYQIQHRGIYTFQIPNLAKYVTIYTFAYKPFNYYHQFDPYNYTKFDLNDLEAKISNSKDIGDKYYTLLDVLYGASLNRFWSKMASTIHNKRENESNNELGYFFSWNDFRHDNTKPKQIFLLKDNITNDSLYCLGMERFVLVPYFVKQKLLYEKKTLVCLRDLEEKDAKTDKEVNISRLSKWVCDQVTLLKNHANSINYILTNDLGETILINDINDSFIDEQVYDEAEKEKKLNQAELLKRKREQEILERRNQEIEKETYMAFCIGKFGQSNGILIAQGKIKIGMTAEMCLASWKDPFWKHKTITEAGNTETWFYPGAELYFQNGLLKQIDRDY